LGTENGNITPDEPKPGLISVVMATYNGERYLAEQLGSILNQSYKNMEIICVDDCSTDGTIGILNEIKRSYPNIIKIHRNEQNLGLRKTFEKGTLLANGEFIAYSDQDDWWFPVKLRELHRKITENRKLAFVYSNAELVDENLQLIRETVFSPKDRPFKGDKYYNVVFENRVMGCTILARTDFVQKVLPFPSKGFYQDWYLAIMAQALNYPVDYVDKPLIKYRRHRSNVVGRDKKFKKKSSYKERTRRRYNQLHSLDFSKFRNPKLEELLKMEMDMLSLILEKKPIKAYRSLRSFYGELEKLITVPSRIKYSDMRLILRGMFFR